MSNPLRPGLRPPLPHQKKPIGIVAGLDHPAIFMDKRLGKCMVALRHAILNGCRRGLIAAPLSACPGWLDELEADHLQGHFLYGRFEDRELEFCRLINDLARDPEPHFFIINKEGLYQPKGRQKVLCGTCDGAGAWNADDPSSAATCHVCNGTGMVQVPGAKPLPSAVALFPWDHVIWDESTDLRNPKSQIAEIANSCFHDRPHRCILSGEYAPEGPMDVYGQMRFLLGGKFMGARNFWRWRDDLFQQVGYDWVPKKGSTKLIRTAIEAHSVILSRKAAGLGEIKTFERVVVDLPPKIRKAYDHAEKYFELPSEAWEGAEAPPETEYAVVVKGWLSQIAGGHPKNFPALHSDHKLDALVELCCARYRQDKLVVTFRYNSELFAAHKALIQHKSVCATVTGATPPLERRALQKQFQLGSLRVLLMQAKVARFGIDLSAADTMIRYSLPEAYEDISQPMDRIVHPMKKRPLHYIDLQTRDTRDVDKWMAMGDKRDVARMYMRRTDEFMKMRLTKKYGELPEALR